MVEFGADVDEHGVATADDERDVRFEGIKLGAVVTDPRGVEMCLVMVDAEEGFAQRVGESLAGLKTDDEGRREAWALSSGNCVESGGLDTGEMKRLPCYGDQVAKVFASGEFGNDAAIFGVHGDLRGDDAGEDGAITNDGDAGFIAGSLDRSEQHAN